MHYISTADAVHVARQPAVTEANKINVPDIPTREIVRKASGLSISIAVVLLTVAGGFWMNAKAIVDILAAPDRLKALEETVQHCHQDKVRLETEIQTLRNRVVDLEREVQRHTNVNTN